jgi:hypothetical protein
MRLTGRIWHGVSELLRLRSGKGLIRIGADDPEAYDGAPVGLQIVARKYDEEKVWAIAKIVDDIQRNSSKATCC